MAAIPPYRRISYEDLDLDNPEQAILQMLEPINLNFEAYSNALVKGLTFDNNFSATIREITFSTPPTYTSGPAFTTITVAHRLPGRARGVTIQQIYQVGALFDPLTDPVSLSWYDDGAGNAVITRIAGLQPSTEYFVRLLIV